MKSFLILSSLVYTLSLSLPQSGPAHMSLYESSEIENRINSQFESKTVQVELMAFYTDPDTYKMVPSAVVPASDSREKTEYSGLEVFGVKIPADNTE